jgi:hypothetical protein
MQNKIQQIKNSWTYRHPQLVVIMSLVVVIILQAFPIELPTKVLAYEATKTVELTPEALLEKYTQEMHESMLGEAKIRATRRLFDELGTIVEDLKPE